jgi:hypothetical protein
MMLEIQRGGCQSFRALIIDREVPPKRHGRAVQGGIIFYAGLHSFVGCQEHLRHLPL